LTTHHHHKTFFLDHTTVIEWSIMLLIRMWQTYNTLALGDLMSSFSQLIVFFSLFERVCNAHIHIHIDRRSKAVLLSREECTIVLVLLLLFLLSFLCNQKSSCLTITGDMIYNHFFFCLSLESLRWHIHRNFYRHLISICFRSSIYHHLIWTLLLLLKSEYETYKHVLEE
jgi:hypothetical protein